MAKYNPYPRTRPRTLQDMLTEGGLRVAATIAKMGWSGIVAEQKARQAFPNARQQSLEALLRYGREEASRLAAFRTAGATDVIAPPAQYRNLDVPRGVRYRARVSVRPDEGDTQKVVITVDSPNALSKGEIRERIRGVLSDWEAVGRRQYWEEGTELRLVGPITLVAVERGAS